MNFKLTTMNKILLITNAFVGLSLTGLSQTRPIENPYNILWLSCEDIDPILGCYGTKGIETPNIDRLAREGIRYSHAYATVGVCAPSRSSIITGMYPVSIGTHNMRTSGNIMYQGVDGEKYIEKQAVTGKGSGV